MSAETWADRAVHRADGPARDGARACRRRSASAGCWRESSFPGKALLETFVSLPLVLPPVATGLLLLWLFGRRSPVGQALDAIGIEVIFTWKAVVLAMMVISFPLVARSVRAGIEQVDRRYEQHRRDARRRIRSASCGPSRCRWPRAASRPAPCWAFRARLASLARPS